MQLNANRIKSLDVFRGLTIAAMILVNSPGNHVAYHWLEHSIWNGCTLADLVFPFFIVIVGASSVLALSTLKTKGITNQELVKKIIKRSVYLFLMGLLINAFPHHFDFSTLRIMGVLQRIALCYFFSSCLFLMTSKKTQIVCIAILLIGYWLLMSLFSPQLVGYWDQIILSSSHLYTPSFDPEGLLSTLPSIASALLGNLLGFCLISSRTKQQRLVWVIQVGLALSMFGLLWSRACPQFKAIN